MHNFELRIADAGAPVCALAAERTWTVGKLKQEVENLTGVPQDEQTLLLGATELQDAQRLGVVFGNDTRSSLMLKRGVSQKLKVLAKMESRSREAAEIVEEAEDRCADPCYVCCPRRRGLPTEQETHHQLLDVLAHVQSRFPSLEHAPEALRGDYEFVLEAVRTRGALLTHASKALRADWGIVLAAVRQDGEAIQFAAPRLRENEQMMLEAVTSCGSALRFASLALREDLGLVLAAVRQDGTALRYAAHELREREEVGLVAVSCRGEALGFLSQARRRSLLMVLAAVTQNGEALRFASEQLRHDAGVVLKAVKQCGTALKYASEELRGCEDIVCAAVEQAGDGPCMYATASLCSNRDFALRLLKLNGEALRYLSVELRRDPEVVQAALDTCPPAIRHADSQLWGNRKFVLAAVERTGVALAWASPALRADKEVVMVAVRQDACAKEYACRSLQRDQEVLACIASPAECETPPAASEGRSGALSPFSSSLKETTTPSDLHTSLDSLLCSSSPSGSPSRDGL